MRFLSLPFLMIIALGLLTAQPLFAAFQCPGTVPVQGAPPPEPLPVFPSDNWWNLDIQSAPVDPGSASYIAFINNGGTRRLHPDFGGEASPGSEAIYGMPYAVVDSARHYFSRKLKWGPSDFSSEKLRGDYCLRRPAFVLLRPQCTTPLRYAVHYGPAQMT